MAHTFSSLKSSCRTAQGLSPVVQRPPVFSPIVLLIALLAGCSGSGPVGPCPDLDCGLHGTCDPGFGTCQCATGWTGADCSECGPGFVLRSDECAVAACQEDADCDDGQACNGPEGCDPDNSCRPGTAVECGSNQICTEPEGQCDCAPGYTGPACDLCADGWIEIAGSCEPTDCETPQAPTLAIIHAGARLDFTTSCGRPVQVGTSTDPAATVPNTWQEQAGLDLVPGSLPAEIKVFARVEHPSCATRGTFSHLYEVRAAYPAPADEPDTTAVAAGDPRIQGWANAVQDVTYGEDLDEEWKTPENALGAAEGDSIGIVGLGRGGRIVLAFDPPIQDGPGWDLAVFENGFTDSFLDLALVEVSTDGEQFLRFDHASLGEDPVDAFGTLDTTLLGSLAGKYRQGYGTPFDLQVFANSLQVSSGLVDLDRIRYVAIVDVPGDGSLSDSFGNPIYDPYPTTGSAGFDLDAVGVLNQAP